MQFFIFQKKLRQNDQYSSSTPLKTYFHKKQSINRTFFPLEIFKITTIFPFFQSIYFYLHYMLLQLCNTFQLQQMIDNAQSQNCQQLPYIYNQKYDDTNINELFLADMLQEDTIKLSGFSIYERPHLWNSIQYQFKSREQAKMEINEEVLNEIISQRNVPNIKSLYASKAKRHSLSLNKQLSTTKKDIVSLAKKLNRRQLSKNRGFEGSTQKWLWKQQKLFVWIIIYYSEVKFLQLNSFGQKDFLILNKLFPLKSPQFLRYQYYLTFCVDRDLRVAWNQHQIDIFDKILIDQQNQKNLYHWKKVSFLLFRQSNGNFFKSAQSCRNRWENHSNPNLNKKLWSVQEDFKLFNATSQFGSKWAKIARLCFQGRTQHMIKNRFRCLSKKFDLDDLSVQEASKILLKKLINHSQPMVKEESQSQNMCKNQQQTFKEQQEGTIITQQDKQMKQQIIERPFLQLRKKDSNLLTIDEILSLSKSQQEFHIQFQQFEEQWLDGLMNRIQVFNPNSIFQGDYL